jgi:hypothetical protein
MTGGKAEVGAGSATAADRGEAQALVVFHKGPVHHRQWTCQPVVTSGPGHTIRIQFDGADILLQDIDPLDWKLRPPRPKEKPALKWLAYGSSITNADEFGYPLVAAQLLPADVMNKGLSGSCHIESEIADWSASLEFDFATLELELRRVRPLKTSPRAARHSRRFSP